MKPGRRHQKNQQHLIQRLGKGIQQEEEKEQTIQCKYGLLCAHLRAMGQCTMPHRRNHYLFLNIPPPSIALPDLEPEAQQKLSKRQRKEYKIMEKTIKENIDVQALQLQGKKREQEARIITRKQRESKMQIEQIYITRIIQSLDSSQFFDKLNNIDKEQVCLYEIKKKTMIQIHKKNVKLYIDIVDKEYRIAHRIIKEVSKRNQQDVKEIYQDINHNSIPSVRQYFAQYFDPSRGIPLPKSTVLDKQKPLYLSTILYRLFARDPQQYPLSQHFLIQAKASTSRRLVSNIQLYNLVIPYSLSQSTPFNLYIFFHSETTLSLAQTSSHLVQTQLSTLHSKPKPPPQYPFGQLEANIGKFKQWLNKFKQKYHQGSKDSKFVLIFEDGSILLPRKANNEIEAEKVKESTATLNTLLQVLNPMLIMACQEATQSVADSLSERLGKEVTMTAIS